MNYLPKIFIMKRIYLILYKYMIVLKIWIVIWWMICKVMFLIQKIIILIIFSLLSLIKMIFFNLIAKFYYLSYINPILLSNIIIEIQQVKESNIPVQQLDIEKSVVQDQDKLDGLESKNNTRLTLIDPVLLNITNYDIANNTQHEILRNMARQDLQDYTNKMANQMSKGRKKIKEYQIGDLVRVASVSGGICNCKSECNSNKCRCKKAGGNCSSRCHSGRSCQNK